MNIKLARVLVEEGFSYYKMGRWFYRLRRAGYLKGRLPRTSDEWHLALVLVTYAYLRCGGVVTGVSAAVVHGLPVPDWALSRVSVVRPKGWPFVSRYLRVRIGELPPHAVVRRCRLKVPVATVAFTLAELALTLPLEWFLAAGDHALRHGLTTREEILDALACYGPVAGIRAARAAVGELTARSESVGESRSRAHLLRSGLPRPSLQVEVRCRSGRRYRADFLLKANGRTVIGEFDGVAKYHMKTHLGISVEQALTRQQQRDRDLEADGYIVVHWTWQDLDHPHTFLARIAEALQIPLDTLTISIG